MAFGGYGGFPKTFDGKASDFEIEHAALLDALADGYDKSYGTANWAELYAMALGTSMAWAINRRLTNQAIPARMLESLPDWESICKLRPIPGDTLQDRRARVAAKLLGIVSNTLSGMYDACAAQLGAMFVELRTVATANEITYWPGIYPGPPGYEWSSNRCVIAVVVQQGAEDDNAFRLAIERTYQMLDAMAAAWLTFQVGTGSGGFICGQGIVGLTLL